MWSAEKKSETILEGRALVDGQKEGSYLQQQMGDVGSGSVACTTLA